MKENFNETAYNDIAKKDGLVAMMEVLHDINERTKVIELPKEADNDAN